MPQQVTKWKAADGKLFDSRERAVEHDAKQILREELRAIVSQNGQVDEFILSKLVSRWDDIKRLIDDYIVATAINSSPE